MQSCVHLVDLVKSFQTSIYLQILASIQPRTGLSKFTKIKISQKLEKTRKNIVAHPAEEVVGVDVAITDLVNPFAKNILNFQKMIFEKLEKS